MRLVRVFFQIFLDPYPYTRFHQFIFSGEMINRDTITRLGWIDDVLDHRSNIEPMSNPRLPSFPWPHQRALFQYMYEYETKGVTVSETSIFKTQVGILCDRRGTGKRTTLLSFIATFPKGHRIDRLPIPQPLLGIGYWETRENEPTIGGNLIIVPHSLITQWARQIGNFDTLRALVLPNLAKWKGDYTHITQFDVVVISSTIIGAFFNRYKRIRWSRVVFDEVDSIEAVNCPHFQAHMFWCLSAHPRSLLYPSEWNNHLLEVLFPGGSMLYSGFLRQTFQRLAYYTNEHDEIARLFLRTHEEFLEQSVQRPLIQYDTIYAQKHPAELSLQELVDYLGRCDNKDMLYACGIRPRDLKGIIHEGKIVWHQLQHSHRVHSDPDALLQNLVEKQGECTICMEKFEQTACLTCCLNFLCLDCLRSVIRTTVPNHDTGGFLWSIKCPCCRSHCPIPWISYTDKDMIIPEWPIFEPYVDQVIQSIDPDVRTVLLIRDWDDIELWSSAMENAGLEYRIVHGTYNRVNKIIQDFRKGNGCKLLILRHLHRGYHLFPEHVISTDSDASVIEELVDLCAIAGPDSPQKVRVSKVKIQSLDSFEETIS